MKNKIVSLSLCITFVISMLLPQMYASAEGDILYDYVPGDMPANMLTKPDSSNCYTQSNGSLINIAEGTDRTLVWTVADGAANTYWGAGNTYISNYLSGSFEKGKNYVVSADVKNGAPDTDASPVFAVKIGGVLEKMELDSTDEWHKFRRLICATADGTNVCMGFYLAEGNTVGAKILMNLAGDNAPYIAEECAYDISNTVSEGSADNLKGGDSLTLSAAVLNQLGEAGTLPQSFKWSAVCHDRRTAADKITVEPEDDTESAVITLADNIENGIYYIAASSEDYPELVKTVKITVGEPIEDFTSPEKASNMLSEPISVNFYSTSNNGKVSKEYTDSTIVYTLEEGALPLSASFPVHGTYTDHTNNNFKDRLFEGGKDYVFSAKVRNAGAEDASPSFGFGLVSSDGTDSCMPSATAEVTETEEWQDFYGSLHVEYGGASAAVMVGFPLEGAEEGSSVELLTADTYLAEEQKYDITADVSEGSNILLRGDTVKVSAEVINQLGRTGNLAQNFAWSVIDDMKIGAVNGFDIEVSDDTKSASITVGDDVQLGTYYIAAASEDYPEMVRTLEIKVKKDARLYVSPSGDDENDGSIGQPFATIAKAKNEAANLDKENYKNIEIILRGGEYRLAEPLQFTSSDSGNDEVQITYKSFEGEKASIKGSVVLDGSKAREVLDADLLDRMYPEVRGKVVVFDLAEQGISADDICDVTNVASFYELKGGAELNSVYINGAEQTVAQWPNDRKYSVRGEPVMVNEDDEYATAFTYTEAEPDRWEKAENWYIGAFLPYDYSCARISAVSVDTTNKQIQVIAGGKDFAIRDTFSNRWKAFNLLEEIDLPGEYYIDRDALKLYLYPPCDLDNAYIEFSKSASTPIVFNGAHDIALEGIEIAQTRGSAVSMTDVVNVDITDCSFIDISGSAIVVTGTAKAETNKDYWQRQMVDGSYKVDIKGCVFNNIGSTAINMTGGNVDTLTKSDNVIENNFIYNTHSKAIPAVSASVSLGGCGITFRHNNLALAPGGAVLLNGNDHLIEYNEIYNVLLEVADAGAIYQGRNHIARGSVIQYNYLHDMVPTSSLSHSSQVGIYYDDCQQGLTARYNIIKNVKTELNSNGGGAIQHKYNTSIDVGTAWNFLNHSLTATKNVTDAMKVSVNGEDVMWSVSDVIEQIYDKELYFERYPDLEKWADTECEEGNNAKLFTVIEENLAVNAGATGIGTQDTSFATISGNQTVTDEEYSIFVNPKGQDYRLKSSSSLAQEMPDILNESFDIEKIGMQKTFVLDADSSGFEQVYPQNGQTVQYSEDGVTFLWQNAMGATKYRLVVAKDADFADPVYDEAVSYHSQTVEGLENDTTYYWKVEAENTSRELASVWESRNAGSSFSLASYTENVSLSDISMSTADGKTTVKTTVTNNAVSDSADMMITFAVYDSDNVMHDTESFFEQLACGEALQKECTFDTEGLYTADKITIFVWEKGTLRPLRECRILR